jgi:hypothetical protein
MVVVVRMVFLLKMFGRARLAMVGVVIMAHPDVVVKGKFDLIGTVPFEHSVYYRTIIWC